MKKKYTPFILPSYLGCYFQYMLLYKQFNWINSISSLSGGNNVNNLNNLNGVCSVQTV